jgi:hypothetical protein
LLKALLEVLVSCEIEEGKQDTQQNQDS